MITERATELRTRPTPRRHFGSAGCLALGALVLLASSFSFVRLSSAGVLDARSPRPGPAPGAVQAECGFRDDDIDGLDDRLEARLIDYYRPILRFDSAEDKWPSRVTWFVQNCDGLVSSLRPGQSHLVLDGPTLAAHPERLLEPLPGGLSANMAGGPRTADLYLALRDGAGAGEGSDSRRGTFARVTPVSISETNRPQYMDASGFVGNYIQLQYVQFFPLNNFHGDWGFADHIGDWGFLDLYVQAAEPYGIVCGYFHHHGDTDCPPTRWSPQMGVATHGDSIPRCFLEPGNHEWWPMASGGGECSFSVFFDEFPNDRHDGLGVQYRAEQVLNLGNAGLPIPQSDPALDLEVRLASLYNGVWGLADSPRGPCNQHYMEPAPQPMFHAPTLLSPADGVDGCASSPFPLKWGAVPIANRYRIQIATTSSIDATIVSDYYVCSDITESTPDLPTGRVYYWRVAACWSVSQSEIASEVRSFYLQTLLLGPSPLSPPDSATVPRPVTLAWSPVTGATGYRVTTTCGTSRNYPVGPAETQLTLDPGEGTFNWCVVALNANGCAGGNGGWRTFSTAACARVTPLSPRDHEDCVPPASALTWTPVPGATGYFVSLEAASQGGEYFVTEPRYMLPQLPYSSGVRWSVRTACECSESFRPWSFRLSPPPLDPPPLVTPADGAGGVGASVTLTWQPVEREGELGPTRYQVQLGTQCGTGYTLDTTATAVTFAGLADDTEYFWRVRAQDGCLPWSAFSSCRSVRTASNAGQNRVFVGATPAVFRGQSNVQVPVMFENLEPVRGMSFTLELNPSIFEVVGFQLRDTRWAGAPDSVLTQSNGRIRVHMSFGTNCRQGTLPPGVGTAAILYVRVRESARYGPTPLTLSAASFNGCSAGDPTVQLYDGLAYVLDGVADVDGPPPLGALPTHPVLVGAAPNPAVTSSRIRFGVPAAMFTTISLLDVAGREVREVYRGTASPGWHDIPWSPGHGAGVGLPHGVYFLVMRAGGESKMTRLVVAR